MAERDEAAIEAEIQYKGLIAPRLTPREIDNAIAGVRYWRVPMTTCTVCALVLRNGFVVIGESAAASEENFDQALGEKIAFQNARQKIWPLEGYRLRSNLASQSHAP